jgi:hypothetical protein
VRSSSVRGVFLDDVEDELEYWTAGAAAGLAYAGAAAAAAGIAYAGAAAGLPSVGVDQDKLVKDEDEDDRSASLDFSSEEHAGDDNNGIPDPTLLIVIVRLSGGSSFIRFSRATF